MSEIEMSKEFAVEVAEQLLLMAAVAGFGASIAIVVFATRTPVGTRYEVVAAAGRMAWTLARVALFVGVGSLAVGWYADRTEVTA